MVLHHLLQCADVQLTPLRWLLFTMSEEGSTRIGHVIDSIYVARLEVHSSYVDRLLERCAESISRSAGKPGRHLKPVLVVDEMQVLLDRSVVNNRGETKSLMRAAVGSACLLSLSVVWSGTRLDVEANKKATAFAKDLLNMRQQNVVGNFNYLEVEDVHRLLSRVLPLASLAETTVSHMCYALQRRARTCAGFITHLLTPGGPGMQPGAVLSDDVVLNVCEDFLRTTVLSRVPADLATLSSDELGYLFCRTLLPVTLLPSDPGDRQNCIAFTESVREATVAIEPGVSEAQVRYSFTYRYGEPTLQEALLRPFREDFSIADRSICTMLSSALALSELGSYLNYAVVLSLLCKGALALRALVAGTNFEMYSSYVLSLDRIVRTSTVDEQLEWFRRVLADPDDCHFSLLPGVPVKKIILLPKVLSEADGICVALPRDQQQPAEHSVPDARKRKDSPVKLNPNVVFMHFCCATYEGGATQAKHESQLKSGDQFLQVSEKQCKAAQRYKVVAQQYAEEHDVIPVLVEIPGNKQIDPSEVRDVVIVTNTHKGLELLSQDAINVLTHSHSESAPSGGPKG